MKKTIIDNKQLKTIVNNNWQYFLINLAKYRILINKREIKENIEYEDELIIIINFFGALKDELNLEDMIKFDLKEINNQIQQKCNKFEEICIKRGERHEYRTRFYFDRALEKEILHNHNKSIKYSNQIYKKQIIEDYFKTKDQKDKYEEWKKNYFISINEKVTKNSVEQGIDALEYFKDEINSINLQNQPSTSGYKWNGNTV